MRTVAAAWFSGYLTPSPKAGIARFGHFEVLDFIEQLDFLTIRLIFARAVASLAVLGLTNGARTLQTELGNREGHKALLIRG